ncbi:MAG: hypothetical protein EA362_08370 [Saprospirales bacterium]|nr:MAG: hypothetical protein EA362_08370 [Saprospirales bacterium]
MKKSKQFWNAYMCFILSNRKIFYAVSFAEIFFFMLIIRLLTNSPIELKFLADVTIVFLTCVFVIQFLLGGYEGLKVKFHENLDKTSQI